LAVDRSLLAVEGAGTANGQRRTANAYLSLADRCWPLSERVWVWIPTANGQRRTPTYRWPIAVGRSPRPF